MVQPVAVWQCPPRRSHDGLLLAMSWHNNQRVRALIQVPSYTCACVVGPVGSWWPVFWTTVTRKRYV